MNDRKRLLDGIRELRKSFPLVDFDEDEHPRGDGGRFASKPTNSQEVLDRLLSIESPEDLQSVVSEMRSQGVSDGDLMAAMSAASAGKRTFVYRIQPKGLGVDHKSEDSSGDSLHLHAFTSPESALNSEEHPTVYGDEVVEMAVDRYWDNGDVEGVGVDGSNAVVTRRWGLEGFARYASPGLDLSGYETSYAFKDHPYWSAAREGWSKREATGVSHEEAIESHVDSNVASAIQQAEESGDLEGAFLSFMQNTYDSVLEDGYTPDEAFDAQGWFVAKFNKKTGSSF